MMLPCPHCGRGATCQCVFDPPAPGLSPDMLSEEDRRELTSLLAAARYYIEAQVGKGFVPSYIAWADRLLADNHGEGWCDFSY